MYLYTLDGGKLRYRPKSLLDPEDVEKLKQHKPELLGLVDFVEQRQSSPSVSSVPGVPPDSNADTYGDSYRYAYRNTSGNGDASSVRPELPEVLKREMEEAERLGLVARFSPEFGFISIHDPTTGEWHDVTMKDAPQWAKSEASRRKRLRKAGDYQLYTARELAELWAEDRTEVWDEPTSVVELAPGRMHRLIYDEDLPNEEDD